MNFDMTSFLQESSKEFGKSYKKNLWIKKGFYNDLAKYYQIF